jgi:uncharacterized protein YfaS (alpha-2-macroglobulin family)
VLAAQLYREINQPLPGKLVAETDAAKQALASSHSPFVQSLLLLGQGNTNPGQTVALLARVSADMPTMERAIALTWLQKALGGAPGSAAPTNAPSAIGAGQWQAINSPTGQREWHWSGSTAPSALSLAPASAASGDNTPVAVISYESRAKQGMQLPITLQRKLYKLVAQATPTNSSGDVEAGDQGRTYAAEEVPVGSTLEANTLYVDEVTLTPDKHGSYRYGLLEVPLPPGGDVEASTWGLTITGLSGAGEDARLQRAPVRQVQHEMGEMSYRQPVASLDHPQVYRQLVRFSLPGTFSLPPARYFRMYQPEAKALQDDGKKNFTMVVK